MGFRKVLFVCSGNVCRSPMAHAIFEDMADKDRELRSNGIHARSAGTLDLGRQRVSNEVIEGSVDKMGTFSPGMSAGLFLSGFAFALTSFLVFSRARRSPEVAVLSLLLITGAWALTIAPATAQWLWWAQAMDAMSVSWSAALFLLFFTIFPPAQSDLLSRRKCWILAILAAPIVLSILWAVSVSWLPDIFIAVQRSCLGFVAGGLTGGAILMIRSYVATRSPVVREQLRVMVVGTVTPVLFFALFGITPQAGGLAPIVRPEILVLGLLLFPLSFCYAIMRHQLMGIRRLVHRSAAYLLLLMAILVTYSALIHAVSTIGGTQLASNSIVQMVLLLLLFVGIPFIAGSRRLAFAVVDRLLYKEYIDYGELVRRVSLQAASTRELDQLQDTALETIAHGLRLSFAAFLQVEDGCAFIRTSTGTLPEQVGAELTAKVTKVGESCGEIHEVFLTTLAAKAICAHLQNRAEKPWVVCFGPRTNEEPFRREDIETVQTIAGQLSTIIEKLQLLDELQTTAQKLREMNRRLVDAQEEERALISTYLHDEPLQKITYLLWSCRESGVPKGFEQVLAQLAEELRDFTVMLRPAVLDDLGLVRALEWLTTESHVQSSALIDFSIDGIGRDDRFDRDIEMALYRVAQEALTNCQKHAKAGLVQVTLSRVANSILLRVVDNGVGIRRFKTGDNIRRLGIASMRERVEQVGGRFSICRGRVNGTIVEASVP